MQMIQMARETNCNHHHPNANASVTTSIHHITTGTSSNHVNQQQQQQDNSSQRQVVHCNNILKSSNVYTTHCTSSKMGLLSLSLDTKANDTRESSVISPSCQPVSCMHHRHRQQASSSQQQEQSSPCPRDSSSPLQSQSASTQQQQQQPQQHREEEEWSLHEPTPPPPPPPTSTTVPLLQATLKQQQQQKQQETCSIVQGKQRRTIDEHMNNHIKPSMSYTTGCISKSSNKQQLICKQQQQQQHNVTYTGNNASARSSSCEETVPSVYTTGGPSNISTDILIKSSANSGYCSSFGSSSTSFFDDEDTTSQMCDNGNVESSHMMSRDHTDDNIDADGLVDHVVADATDDDDIDALIDNCREGGGVGEAKKESSTLHTDSVVTREGNTCIGKESSIQLMHQITSNASNTTVQDESVSGIAGDESYKDTSSNCTNNNNNNIQNVTGDDDDSHAYPIHIQCGANELTLMIEENLTAAYLINILLLRFSLEEDISWTLFLNVKCNPQEQQQDTPIHLQCMIEDFEEVVPLVLKYRGVSFVSDVKLLLERTPEKLTMYNNLHQFFDLNMIDLGEYGRIRSSSISFTNVSTHSNRSNSFDGSNASIRKPITGVSSNEYQALQRFLLISDTFDLIVTSPVKVTRVCSSSAVESHSAVLDKTQLTLSHVNSMCKDVIDFRSNRYDLFTCSSSSPSTQDTGEHCFYLVSPRESCPMYKVMSVNRCTNICWISCLRLAKIGMQNMRRYIKSYKASQNTSSSSAQQQQQPQQQQQQQQQQQSVQNHVRHGSFGSKGSNVSLSASSPPSIASYNANVSSSSLFCRQNNIRNHSHPQQQQQQHSMSHSSLVSPSSCNNSSSSVTLSSSTSCKLGPWFYDNLTREQASKLLSQYLSINGVFLVRQSTRAPGTFVLSLVLNRKILHIIVMSVQIDAHTCYLTLDQGKTKFADLSQLIQFYQLNHSLLGCKLTHYVSRG